MPKLDLRRIVRAQVKFVTLRLAVDRCHHNGALYPSDYAAGNAVNGGRTVQSLGGQPQVYALVGEENCTVFLEIDGMDLRLTYARGATRICEYNVDSNGRERRRHPEDSGFTGNPKHVTAVKRQLKKHVRPGHIVVLTGSLPDGIGAHVYADMVRWLHELGAFVILDARPEQLDEVLRAEDPACHPDVLKANFDEWRGLVKGKKRPIIRELIEQAHDRFPDTIVIISLGSKGVLFCMGDNAYRVTCNPDGLTVRTRRGCGDALVAAFALALNDGCSFLECLFRAVAAATANLTDPMPGYFPPETFVDFLPWVRVTQVWRDGKPARQQVKLALAA